jgi:hypothetical protein
MEDNSKTVPKSIYMLKLVENGPIYSHMKILGHFGYFHHLEKWQMPTAIALCSRFPKWGRSSKSVQNSRRNRGKR